MQLKPSDIFPIVDSPSAQLMKLKAHCLCAAGIISATEKAEVDRLADKWLAPPASVEATSSKPARGIRAA